MLNINRIHKRHPVTRKLGLDNDNDADIIGTGYFEADIACWINDGNGSFSKQTVDGLFNAFSVHGADLDGDNTKDIIGAGYGISWWKKGSGDDWDEHTIDPSFSYSHAVCAGDLDGDNDIDVAAGARSLHWWENDGTGGGWTEHVIDDGFTSVDSVAILDLDGDGDADLVADGYYGIAWWENSGAGDTWTKHVVDRYGGSPVHACEISGQGYPDLVDGSDNIKWRPLLFDVGFTSPSETKPIPDSAAHFQVKSVDSEAMSSATIRNACVTWSISDGDPASGEGPSTPWRPLTNDTSVAFGWHTQYWVEAVSLHGDVIPSSSWFNAESQVDFLSEAEAGYRFAHWTGSVDSVSNPLSVFVAHPLTLTALCEPLAPLEWLSEYGWAPSNAVLDQDFDGMLTWEEYYADTVPTNQDSVLALTAITPLASNRFLISWQGGLLVTQVLHRSTALTESGHDWVPCFTNIPPTEASSCQHEVINSKPTTFYRLTTSR